MPAPRPGARHGRPRVHPVPSAGSARAEQVLAGVRWRRLTWRAGTKGALSARFAAARIVVADGAQNAGGQHLPGEAAWVVGERRAPGETKYYLANLGPEATLRQLAAAIKARWACEQAHQQLKEELGLDHFEGRTWTGLHHHALLSRLRRRRGVCVDSAAPVPSPRRCPPRHGPSVPGAPPCDVHAPASV
jgi:SRSO17 transposase